MKRRLGLTDSGEVEVRAEINVTSLVDVAFTLLIIFMITAPILQGGVEIDVPEGPATPISSAEALVISIDENSQIFIEDTPVSLEELAATIGTILERRDTEDVWVKGDANLEYGMVFRVLGRLQEAGVENVGLVGIPEYRPAP